MNKALEQLVAFRGSREAKPWPRPGADLRIFQYGPWIERVRAFWIESGSGVRRAFEADRKKLVETTRAALSGLRDAVKRHGSAFCRALSRGAKEAIERAAEYRQQADDAEANGVHPGQLAVLRTTAQDADRWSEELVAAKKWSRHRVRAWLAEIAKTIKDPLSKPLVSFGVPPGGEEICDCPWRGVFGNSWRSYPNNLPPSMSEAAPGSSQVRTTFIPSDFDRSASTMQRFGGPLLEPPQAYLDALRAQAASPWIAVRALSELLGTSSASPRNELLGPNDADLWQLGEWWWFAVSPRIRDWYAIHEPDGKPQLVLGLWEKRLELSSSDGHRFVHAAELRAGAYKYSDWMVVRQAGRTPSSPDAESLALTLAALMDSLLGAVERRQNRRKPPKADKKARRFAILSLRIEYQKKNGGWPSNRWVAKKLPPGLKCTHKTVAADLRRLQEDHGA